MDGYIALDCNSNTNYPKTGSHKKQSSHQHIDMCLCFHKIQLLIETSCFNTSLYKYKAL